ncbi:tagaturonate reductase [Pedobacter insulae]|uniref:Tagaturonate reductase n=1 Tax=Pedobacter insulae TaxID=414048 RepID=A0A1I2ZYX4_9SPHI|nr:tagaturonate reductase [Pedobacter insulae]SFH42860.1 tagaturonate reductase [Pedobacter insulae]
MILSQENLQFINREHIVTPLASSFDLPEKVLQFGTGVLLRGLPDYFIHKANQQGVFNGRIAVVKSTRGDTTEFDSQDSLYTLCIRGVESGQLVEENIISSAISRVIAAENDWASVLSVASSKDLKIIVSNTTEVGITLVNEKIDQNPPSSFPAKVLAVLYQRFKAFGGSKDSGLVIIATELIPDNGTKLATIVLQLAQFNNLESSFVAWLTTANKFCNSLVDRIVPGKPDENTVAELQQALGYKDELLAMAEPYRLWAIEGAEQVKEVLEFAAVDAGVIIAEDIEIYRELKVRLLNGTHTLSAGIAFLLGIDTVKNAMKDEQVKQYISTLMSNEISLAIPYEVNAKQTTDFSKSVIDRFANPFIEHLWHSITFQYTMKMKIRILPLIANYYDIYNKVPAHIALGFAAYLVFMKANHKEDGKYYGSLNGKTYLINDDSAAYFHQQQKENYVTNVLSDSGFWKLDLAALPGFMETVNEKYNEILNNGMETALSNLSTTKIYSA